MRRLAIALITLCLLAPPARADGWRILDGKSWRWADAETETVNSVAVFAGEGTELHFSEIVTEPYRYSGSSDRIVALTAGRRIAWFRDQLSVDAELLYARHHGRADYHEFGFAGYLRWHEFPWNEYVRTTFAVGTGPSYTTNYSKLEGGDDGNTSKLLNQFNLELTLALPDYARTSLVGRLQHRSGIFGLIDGVEDGSNFLTLGIRHEF